MAWIKYDGKPVEVNITRLPVTIIEVWAKAKDGCLSIPVFDEQIFETLDDYNMGISLRDKKEKEHK
jgi:hypothetical protein